MAARSRPVWVEVALREPEMAAILNFPCIGWDGEDIFIMGKVLGFNEGRSENREF